MLGTDDLNAYLNKYRLELDPHLEALVGRYVLVMYILEKHPRNFLVMCTPG